MGTRSCGWIAERRRRLIGSIAAPAEQGVFFETLSEEQEAVLLHAAAEARQYAASRGDLDRASLAPWKVDEHSLPIHLREGDVLTVDRLLEVAEAVEAILQGRLQPHPPYARWVVGTGAPGSTINSIVP